MPRVARWMIRSALVYAVVGFVVGGGILTAKALGGTVRAAWLSLHVHALLLGFTVQFALGVAHWILPRVGGSRGSARVAWLGFALLNVGLMLSAVRCAVPIGRDVAGGPSGALAAMAILGGVTMLAFHLRPRMARRPPSEEAR